MLSDFDNIPTLPKIFGPIRQVSYVVDDIDAAIREWQERYGVGPFLVARNEEPLNNAYYRGQKAGKTILNIAFAYVDGQQLELTQLVGNTPSLYLEAHQRNLKGVHHYAVGVENFAEAYNYALDNGYEVVVDAGVDGLARMSYLENRDKGLIVEVIEWNALTRPYFDGIEKLVLEADPMKLTHEFKLSDITPIAPLMTGLGKFLLNKLLGRIVSTRRQ